MADFVLHIELCHMEHMHGEFAKSHLGVMQMPEQCYPPMLPGTSIAYDAAEITFPA